MRKSKSSKFDRFDFGMSKKADLIPEVEKLRAAYIKDFGHPPPPRPRKKDGE